MASNANSTSVRPGRGPTVVDSRGTLALHTERGGATANVSDHGSKSTATIALILSSLSLGILLAVIPLGVMLMDAKVTAGTAKAEATAQTAKEHARVALDKVEQTQVQLGAKGLVQPSTH